MRKLKCESITRKVTTAGPALKTAVLIIQLQVYNHLITWNDTMWENVIQYVSLIKYLIPGLDFAEQSYYT